MKLFREKPNKYKHIDELSINSKLIRILQKTAKDLRELSDTNLIFKRIYRLINDLNILDTLEEKESSTKIIDTELNNRAFYRFYEILENLEARLDLVFISEGNADDIFKIILDQLLSEEFQLSSRETIAVNVMPLLEARSENAELLILAGLNESNIPKRNNDESILTVSEFIDFELNIQDFPIEEDRYLLNFLLKKPISNVYLSSHQSFIESEEIESIFIDELKQKYHINDWPEFSVSYENHSREVNLNQPNNFYVQDKKSYSVTEFEEYQACSYQYFLKRELKIDSFEDSDHEDTALKFGNLIHKVFYNLYYQNSDFLNNENRVELFRSEIESVLNQEENFSIQERELVKNFLDTENYIETLFTEEEKTDAYHPKHFEWSFGLNIENDKKDKDSVRETFKLKRENEIIEFNGKIDRIDINHNNEAVILDYKNSKKQSFNDYYSLKKFQLALYLLAVKEILKKDVNAGILFQVHPEMIKKRIGLFEKDEFKSRDSVPELYHSSVDNYLEAVKDELFSIREKIKTGKFKLNPIDDNICEFCNYKLACRINEYKNLTV